MALLWLVPPRLAVLAGSPLPPTSPSNNPSLVRVAASGGSGWERSPARGPRPPRVFCPVDGCPCADASSARGWASHSAMRPHLDDHAAGTLRGAVPAAYSAAQNLEPCSVCGLFVATRYNGSHPRRRPLARGVAAAGGSPAVADGGGPLSSCQPCPPPCAQGRQRTLGSMPCPSFGGRGPSQYPCRMARTIDAAQGRPAPCSTWWCPSAGAGGAVHSPTLQPLAGRGEGRTFGSLPCPPPSPSAPLRRGPL